MDAIELAAVLVTLALLASMVSVESGVTVALVELTFGVVAGNVLDLQNQDWLTFVAAFASIVLTFLAGMEVDPGVHAAASERVRWDRLRVVHRAVRLLVGGRVRPARLEWTRVPDRRYSPLDDVARGCLLRSR